MHPDPGFAFNPANNVSGRVPQQKKQEQKKTEQKKTEVNTQPEPVAKPDELGKDDAASEKNFEKKGKKVQKPVTSSKKKRYNNVGVSKSTVKPVSSFLAETPLIPKDQNGIVIPAQGGKFHAIYGTMVKTTATREEAVKAILDAGGKVWEEEADKANNEIEKNVLHDVIISQDTNGHPVITIDKQTLKEERKKVVDEFIDLSKKNWNKEDAQKLAEELLLDTMKGGDKSLNRNNDETGLERCIVLSHGGILLSYSVGTTDSVAPEKIHPAFLKNSTCIHNHPLGSAPSIQDIDYLINNKLGKMVVVTEYGKYTISLKDNSYNSENEEIQDVLNELNEMSKYFDGTYEFEELSKKDYRIGDELLAEFVVRNMQEFDDIIKRQLSYLEKRFEWYYSFFKMEEAMLSKFNFTFDPYKQ